MLDTTEQPIERPQDNERQREYYSGKKKRHTVKAQVIGNRWREVVAITLAVSGKTADIEIARRSRLVMVLPEGTEAYQDKGYVGLEKEVPLLCLPIAPRPRLRQPQGMPSSRGLCFTHPPRSLVGVNCPLSRRSATGKLVVFGWWWNTLLGI